jgi:hypothetical protein
MILQINVICISNCPLLFTWQPGGTNAQPKEPGKPCNNKCERNKLRLRKTDTSDTINAIDLNEFNNETFGTIEQ